MKRIFRKNFRKKQKYRWLYMSAWIRHIVWLKITLLYRKRRQKNLITGWSSEEELQEVWQQRLQSDLYSVQWIRLWQKIFQWLEDFLKYCRIMWAFSGISRIMQRLWKPLIQLRQKEPRQTLGQTQKEIHRKILRRDRIRKKMTPHIPRQQMVWLSHARKYTRTVRRSM